jgi:AraC family transcriptional activator of tynA and feaB
MRSTDFLNTSELNYEQWEELPRPNGGLFTLDGPKAFAGRVVFHIHCSIVRV